MHETPGVWHHQELTPAAGGSDFLVLRAPARILILKSDDGSQQRYAFQTAYQADEGLLGDAGLLLLDGSAPLVINPAGAIHVIRVNNDGASLIATQVHYLT